MIFSNLPGPQEPIYIAGERVTTVRCYHPNTCPQLIVISIGGEMHTGLIMSMHGKPGTESDVRIALPRMMEEELDAMCQELGVSC